MNRSYYIPLMLLAAGCSLRPEAGAPQHPDLPDRYPHARTASAGRVDSEWWRSFSSQELNQLVADARHGSHDIAAAMARVDQARAVVRLAEASLFPQLGGSAGAGRDGNLTGASRSRSRESYTAGLSSSYEVDLWGRLRAGRAGAVQSLRADLFDRDAIMLTVTADTAAAWLQSVAALERQDIAGRNLESARKVLSFIESRQRAGAATALELAQQRGLVAAQENALASLRTQVADTQLALGLLLGRASAWKVRTTSLSGVKIPRRNAGLPSSLLVSRPDLARAEAGLKAADADIAAARAAMLPSVNLSAGIDLASPEIANLFNQSLYRLATSVSAPIFQGGRLEASRDQSIARREELLAGYRKAIITAFGEVESALISQAGQEAQQSAQSRQLQEAQKAFELAESRYRAGAETLLSLLQAQTALYAAEDDRVQLHLARLLSSLALYKALGGGWTKP